MTPLYQRIGNRLRQAREQLGLTQEEVAGRLNVVRSQYTHYETGHTPVSIEDLLQLACIYDVAVMWLLDLPGDQDLPPGVREVVEIMQQLDNAAREDVLDYVHYIASKNAGKLHQ